RDAQAASRQLLVAFARPVRVRHAATAGQRRCEARCLGRSQLSGLPFAVDRRETLAMASGAALLPFVGEGQARAAPNVAETALKVGRDQPFNNGWRFLRGAGEGLEALALDDSSWRTVDLPHDWSIEDIPGGQAPDQLGPFSKKSQGGT